MTLSAPTFGEFLRQLRRRAGLTQGELAVIVGFSVAQISRLEKDERLPDVPMVIEKFLPALALEDEPRLAQRLLELAASARGERPPIMVVAQREVRTVVQETMIESDSHLPTTLLPLVGREEDVAVISKRIMEAPGRLLTLIGPPGVGKTQLAMTVATKVQPLFMDGVHFVPLAAITDPDHVPAAIVTNVGLTESDHKAPRVRLIEHLRRKSTLLVLDNFEQVSNAAPLVADLLGECPGLRILATSQEPLRLRTEQRQRVLPLAPAAAVELFFQRAQAIDPDFDTVTQAAIVTAICLRLDCLPLAIELVAAQLELFSPAQILARLQDHALDLLADGPRDLPDHQRTLRNAIHRSYGLLAPREQRLFRTLGVFAGGCTVEALAAVLPGPTGVASESEPLDQLVLSLRTLVRKSLVQQQTLPPSAESGPAPQDRFTLLTTLSAYASEQLVASAEDAPRRHSHAAYYLTLTQAAAQAQLGPTKKTWLDQLTAEHDNLRAALAWSLHHEPALALQLAAGLGEFWATRGHDYEARRWFDQVQAANPAPTATRATILLMAAQLARRQADYTAAQTFMTESLTIYSTHQDQAGLAQAEREAGWLEYDLHHLQPTIDHFRASLALYRQLENKSRIADLLLCLSLVLFGQPQYRDELADALNESLTLFRSLGETEGVIQVLQLRGEMAMLAGNYALAEEHFREVLAFWRGLDDRLRTARAVALVGESAWLQNHLTDALLCYDEAYQIFAELGNKEGCAILRHHQAQVARRQGALAKASAQYGEALTLSQSLHNQYMIARCLAGLGGVALATGDALSAATLLGAAQAQFDQLGPFLAPADAAEFQGFIQATQQALAPAPYATAWQTGQTTPLPELLAVALAVRPGERD